MQEWTNLKLTLKGFKKAPFFSIIILLGGLFMTLKELLNKLDVSNSGQYATLSARFVDKSGRTCDFSYKGFPLMVATLLAIVPAEILKKNVIDFNINVGNERERYGVNQCGKIVKVAFDIIIEF